MTRRTALLGMVLALTAAPAESQTRFDVSMGPQFGMQDRETPLSRGWIVSAGFEIDGQDFVVEGSWHLSGSAHERYFGGDDPRHDIGLELHSGRILSLAAGVRSRKSERPVAPFYQVLAGGAQFVWRTDYEYPAALDVEAANARSCGNYADGVLTHPCLRVRYPEFREERNQGFLLQTGAGLEVRIRREIAFRVAADVMFMANREYVGGFSRLSARVVIGFGD